MDVFPDAGFRPCRAIPRTMCFTSASGCSAERLMSLSFMPWTRAQSVLEVLEEDCRFTLCSLSKRDDVNASPRFRMGDRHRNAFKQAQRHEPLLLVPEPIVLVRKRGALKYPPGIHKIEPVVLQVALALTSSHVNRIGPVYSQSVYTSRCSNSCRLTSTLTGARSTAADEWQRSRARPVLRAVRPHHCDVTL
jgi:hypothetical protein